MQVGIYYHQDFAEQGYFILRDRVKPGFEGLNDLIELGKVKVFTPQINSDSFRLLAMTHTASLISEVKMEGEYEISLLSAAGVVQAAEKLQGGELDMAFCFVGAAGHHASRNSCWGFCFFNDVAMAVTRLHELGTRRIMIIDVDPHFGDGTRDLLGGDRDVIHVNFHSGFVNNENSEWNNYDYGISGADDEKFQKIISEVCSRSWDFEFLILIFGHDSHRTDYGPFNLSQESFPFLGREIRKLAGKRPVLMVLSGGSEPEVARLAIRGLIDGFLEG